MALFDCWTETNREQLWLTKGFESSLINLRARCEQAAQVQAVVNLPSLISLQCWHPLPNTLAVSLLLSVKVPLLQYETQLIYQLGLTLGQKMQDGDFLIVQRLSRSIAVSWFVYAHSGRKSLLALYPFLMLFNNRLGHIQSPMKQRLSNNRRNGRIVRTRMCRDYLIAELTTKSPFRTGTFEPA